MRLLTKILIAFLTVLVSLACYSTATAAGETTYDLRAKLDFDGSELNVSEKVVYLNKTSTRLSSIVFNVSPAHFNAFKLQSVKVGGVDADWRLEDVSLEVTLPGTVEPGEYVEIELQFDLKIPAIGGRFGVYDHVMALGNWYPVVEVYRGGWNKHAYTPFGDPFFTDVADYEVVVESLINLEIAHTGNLVNREGNTWHFKAEKVRDFAMVVSDRYETKSVDVDGIKVTAFNQPGHDKGASAFLDSTERALRWLNKTLGKYPFESLDVAEVNPGKENLVGQEYPNLVFISSAYAVNPEGPKSYGDYVIAHEIVHQWFYGLVGNDQMKEPWIDESLATYLAYRILEWNPLSSSSPAVTPSGKSPVDSTVYDFNDETQYSATAYGKGTVFLQELAATLKGDTMDVCLRDFVNLYKYKVATTRDFLSLVQSHTSTNLNPLFGRYFSSPEYKLDSPLKLEIDWPKAEPWTGTVQIGFTSDSPIKRIEVSADGIPILKADEPSSPLSVDAASLVDGEYVVGLTAYDESGRVGYTARRITVSGGLPVRPASFKLEPTPTPVQSSSETGASVPGAKVPIPGVSFDVKLPDYASTLGWNLTVDLGRILIGVSALASLFVVSILFMAIHSRRSWKSDFQFTGSKSYKHAGLKTGTSETSPFPEVKPISRMSYSIVSDTEPVRKYPPSTSRASSVAEVQSIEVEGAESKAPIPLSNSLSDGEKSKGKRRGNFCTMEGFARREANRADETDG